jgi:RNA polymerase sigma-70 factor (ECF subfamily)
VLTLAASFKQAQQAKATHSEVDHALVARFCRGDPDAFDGIFRRNQDYVYRLCLGMLGDEWWAQDATQEVFVRAYRGLHRFRGESSLRTWLYRITVNECLQQLRKRRCHETVEQADPTDSESQFEDLTDLSAEMETVRAALRRLTPSHRAVLILRYFEEMSYEEIAHAMDSTVKRIRARLHRARESFRVAYAKVSAGTQSGESS